MGDNKTQNMMTSNEIHLTVAIADLIIYKGLSFNLAHKPRFKKLLGFSRTVSKSYQYLNRNMISEDICDVINDQIMERNLSLIKKSRIFYYYYF